MATKNYKIKGMTCQHCVASVTEEVSEVSGVTEVSVNLDTGIATVSGEAFTDEDVKAAVQEAGFSVVES